jgi:hypothetical protein
MRRVIGPLAIGLLGLVVASLAVIVLLPNWLSRHLPAPTTVTALGPAEAAPTIGAPVQAVDGTPVGRVTGISRDQKGRVHRIRIATGTPLGFGERTITVGKEVFVTHDDRVVRLHLTVQQVSELPTIMTEDGAAARMIEF